MDFEKPLKEHLLKSIIIIIINILLSEENTYQKKQFIQFVVFRERSLISWSTGLAKYHTGCRIPVSVRTGGV